MIMSSEPEFRLSPRPGTRLTVDLAGTLFTVPVVGGAGALMRAGGVRP
jgi:X-Pro dipeptidyl-peptidase